MSEILKIIPLIIAGYLLIGLILTSRVWPGTRAELQKDPIGLPPPWICWILQILMWPGWIPENYGRHRMLTKILRRSGKDKNRTRRGNA